MTEQTANQHLFAKMVAILKAIERIPKNGFNEHFRYAYVLDADVLDSVRTQLAQHGVAFFISIADFRQEKQENSKTIKTILFIDATFADADSGESMAVRWIGEADDQQDKGINKALTAGVKYGLIKTFLIPTGDEDADGSATAQAQRSRPAQKQTTHQKPPPDMKDGPNQKPPASKPGLYVMTFGKHMGLTVAEIADQDRQYLDWVIANAPNHPNDVAAIKAYLAAIDAPPDNEKLLAQRREEFRDTMILAFDFASDAQIDAALKSRNKPPVADMTLDQLDAGIAWAKEHITKKGQSA